MSVSSTQYWIEHHCVLYGIASIQAKTVQEIKTHRRGPTLTLLKVISVCQIEVRDAFELVSELKNLLTFLTFAL